MFTINLTKNEWLAMIRPTEERSIIIKPAGKGSCVVAWDRADYLTEAENNNTDSSIYKEVQFGEEEHLMLV